MGDKSGSGSTREARPLTSRAIEAMLPEATPYRVPDARTKGLAVRVATDGKRTFDLAFRVKHGKVRRTSLGEYPGTTLEHARNRAHALTSAARNGVDLLAQEEEARAEAGRQVTVAALIADYMRRSVRKNGLRTADEIERRLKRALATLLDIRASDVKRRDIRDILDAVADQGLEREAEKRRQTVGAMFKWAVGRDIIEHDPTAGLKAFDAGTPRERALDDTEIAKLWPWLDAANLPAGHADIMRLQILLGARCGEVAGIEAGEVDREAWLWTLPAGRSKNKRPRTTPLVGLAREIVERNWPAGGRGALFRSEPGTTLTAGHVGQALLIRAKRLPVEKFTTHDLRRTTATRLADMGISLDLIAAIVGHEAGGSNVRTLVRHYVKTDLVDRKQTALEAWDARVREIVEGRKPAPKVIDLAAARGVA